MNSGRRINYGVRPAKSIERKMMRDLFNRLSVFDPLEKYRYIGFGSKYFCDFVLFHRYLNIGEMISIEADRNNKERYNFNKPYADITVVPGMSTDVLPSLGNVEKKTILWLDYDSTFEKYMLDDVAIVSKTLSSGSNLSVSFNTEAIFSDRDFDLEYLKDTLKKMVGEEYVSPTMDERGWKSSQRLAIFLKNCVMDKILSVLKKRNISLRDEEKIKVKQVMFFTYADGAKMATFSFLFYKQEDEHKVQNSRVNGLYFYRDEDVPFDIKVPNLTIKEIRHIMEVMPDETKINKKIFAIKDVKELWDNYRYFPSFTEIESF
jgi:hypothetical protein